MIAPEMQKASEQARRTLAVLSPDFLASTFTQAEWAAAFKEDPAGEKRTLIPVRVRACEPSVARGAGARERTTKCYETFFG